MLIEHRVDNVNERLIAVDKAVATTEEIALQPSFHGVLAKHFHDPAVCCQLTAVRVFREILAEPSLLADFINSIQLVGLSLVRPSNIVASTMLKGG
jgi:hypothetical protein